MHVLEEKKVPFRMMISVTHAEEEKKINQVMDSLHIPISYRCRGQGTAPSEIMDILGFRGTARLITIIFLPKFMAGEVFEQLSRKMSFKKRGGGIVLTIPITGLQNPMFQMLRFQRMSEENREVIKRGLEGDREEMREHSMYSMIWVSVTSGYSDDVIDAARAAGARGGTVLKGRRRDSEMVKQFFGISIQEEQDFVMIVIPNEKKAEVMAAICHSCGLRTEAHGVVCSLPVDEVMGLE